MIKIKNRFTGKVIHSGDFETIKDCLLDAIENEADLSGTNLSGTNLSGTNLIWCAGNKAEIKSIWAIDDYPITYTAEYIQIGCEKHLISDWAKFDDETIEKMDGEKALKFWRENKDFILSTIERFPAKKTGKEDERN